MVADVGLQAADDCLRPFGAANLRAYLVVLTAWVVVSAAIAGASWALTAGRPSLPGFVITALGAVMGGMGIMFVSSLINLRKLRPAFARMAHGEPDVAIPPVWCPVLTSATQAARKLAREVETNERRKAI